MAAKIFDIGDTAQVEVVFENELEVEADPSTIQFIVLDPSDNEVVSTFPAGITRTAAGRYFALVQIDEEGEFTVRFNGITIGTVISASFESILQGRSSRLTTPLP